MNCRRVAFSELKESGTRELKRFVVSPGSREGKEGTYMQSIVMAVLRLSSVMHVVEERQKVNDVGTGMGVGGSWDLAEG